MGANILNGIAALRETVLRPVCYRSRSEMVDRLLAAQREAVLYRRAHPLTRTLLKTADICEIETGFYVSQTAFRWLLPLAQDVADAMGCAAIQNPAFLPDTTEIAIVGLDREADHAAEAFKRAAGHIRRAEAASVRRLRSCGIPKADATRLAEKSAMDTVDAVCVALREKTPIWPTVPSMVSAHVDRICDCGCKTA